MSSWTARTERSRFQALIRLWPFVRAAAGLSALSLAAASGCRHSDAQRAVARPAGKSDAASCEVSFERESARKLGAYLREALSPCTPGHVVAARQIREGSLRLLRASADLCGQRAKGIVSEPAGRDGVRDLRLRTSALVELLRKASTARDGNDRSMAYLAAWRLVTPEEQRRELGLAATTLAQVAEHAPYEPLPEGAELRTGYALKFAIRLSTPAHVYLFQSGPDGTMRELFPDPRLALSNPLDAGEVITIPPGDAVLRVTDEHHGPETMLVVASLGPIPSLESALPPSCASVPNHPQVIRGLPVMWESEPPPVSGAPIALRILSGPGDDTVVGVMHFNHLR